MVTRDSDRNALIVGACLLLALLMAVCCPAMAHAQSGVVINPNKVSFEVSADHNRSVYGTPAVTTYDLRIFAKGAAAPVTSSDLGKPAAPDGGRVEFDRATVFAAVPIGEYEARVAAVGPGGEGVTPPVPFGRLLAPGVPPNFGLGR